MIEQTKLIEQGGAQRMELRARRDIITARHAHRLREIGMLAAPDLDAVLAWCRNAVRLSRGAAGATVAR